MFIGNHDPYSYFDTVIGGGIRVSTPAVRKMEKSEHIFQIDDRFDDFLEAKWEARRERLSKFYQNNDSVPVDITKFIISRLCSEYPEFFKLDHQVDIGLVLDCKKTGDVLVFAGRHLKLVGQFPNRGYVDAFDALAMQVQEDLVIQEYLFKESRDRARAVHLFHPNGWSAEWAIGKGFAEIHEGVTDPNGKHIVPPAMVKGLVKNPGSVERIGAISFRTDATLNRHPEEYEKAPYPKFDPVECPHLFMRFERQTVTGFPSENCFLFTIKTYFLDVNQEDSEKRAKVISAFENATHEIYAREFLAEKRDLVLQWLKSVDTI